MPFANWLYTIPLRLRSLLARHRQDADLNEELRDHIERQTEENQARGMSKEVARLAALRTFGNFVAVREQTHETWAWSTTEHLAQDLHRAVRSARRAPLLSTVAVLALALGIGLNTGVFTIANALFLRGPTRVDPASFVQVFPRYAGWFTGAEQSLGFTTEDFEAIRDRSNTLGEVSVWRQFPAVLEQETKYVTTLLASCNYFHVLGINQPLMGRFFTASECSAGAPAQVAVISEPLWRNEFAADPQIVGKTIRLNQVPLTVIGVTPSGVANALIGGVVFPYTLGSQLDQSGGLTDNPDKPWLSMTGRLRPGFTRANAQAELTAIMNQQDQAYLQREVSTFDRKTSLTLTDGSQIEHPSIHALAVGMVTLMLGPLALVLLLASSNVAALFLARTIARRGEVAIRLALGVKRSRLATMLLMESLLVVCLGAAFGMVLAFRAPLMILNLLAPGQSSFDLRLSPDWRVFVYLLILMTAATLLSSLLPIRAAWKLDLLTALKGREGGATVRSRTTSGLIITQIALGFVLVCAAVIFGRMPGLIRDINPGFEIRQTLIVPLRVNTSGDDRAKAQMFYRELETKLLAIPGVEAVTYASLLPFTPSPPEEVRLSNQRKGKGQPVSIDEVSNNFFTSFGIGVLRGRAFRSTDVTTTSAAPVAVVSQAFANAFWPDRGAIDKTVIMADDRRLTVVGIVDNTRSAHFGRPDEPRIYTLRSPSTLGGNLYVRFAGNAKPIENAVRETLKRLDPLQTTVPQTIWEAVENHAEAITVMAQIILLVAAIALLMAITGVYCVLSLAVSQRTREFGIRMVLGATRAEVFRMVLLRAIKNIAVGLLSGIVLAEPALLVLNRLLAGSPLPLHQFDSTVFGISAILLTAVSLIAMYIPATRAMNTDPMQVLRMD
jgi:predicted permease